MGFRLQQINTLCSVFVKTGIFCQKYFHPIITILLRLFQIAYRSFLALFKGVEGLGALLVVVHDFFHLLPWSLQTKSVETSNKK